MLRDLLPMHLGACARARIRACARAYTRTCAFAGAALLLLSSCVGTRKLVDPTLVVHTEGGTELGVSTEYGVVFLGRTARAGFIEIAAYFGDGPSLEPTVIEPIGGGLFTARTEIRLPQVPLTFFQPLPGDELIVRGRTESGSWQETVEVRSDPRVYGILLEVPSVLRRRADQVGAGVFVARAGNEDRLELVGLVSGRLRLVGANGTREYLTVMGPEDLWRLVTHRRDHLVREPWVYREDIM